jgi:hypothetical protein
MNGADAVRVISADRSVFPRQWKEPANQKSRPFSGGGSLFCLQTFLLRSF